MSRLVNTCLTALLSTSLIGCASYRTPTQSFANPNNPTEMHASTNKLYDAIPRHRSQLKPYDARWITWSLLGNDDNGIFGEAQPVPYSTNITRKTFCKWTKRNPLHNFFFYTIGSAERTNHTHFSLIEISEKRPYFFSNKEAEVFNGNKFGFQVSCNDYKPFVSLHFPISKKRQFQFYMGAREKGNWGLKFRFAKKDKNTK